MSGGKPKNLLQRTVTAAFLIALVALLIYFGSWAMVAGVVAAGGIAMYEEFKALRNKHHIVSWPTWVGLIVGAPLTLLLGTRVILSVMFGITLVTMLCVVFRKDASLEDMVLGLLPLVSVALPHFCIVAVALVEPKGLQVVLLTLIFTVPVLGDTAAYFGGSRIGGPKLCPAISPNKTIAGAIAGLLGSVASAMLVCLLAHFFLSPATKALAPTWWGYLLLGLFGGVAGQLGDLFASMVKRHAGIKDFSNLFPGHGGMLDRMDSILFMAVVICCYRLFIL